MAWMYTLQRQFFLQSLNSFGQPFVTGVPKTCGRCKLKLACPATMSSSTLKCKYLVSDSILFSFLFLSTIREHTLLTFQFGHTFPPNALSLLFLHYLPCFIPAPTNFASEKTPETTQLQNVTLLYVFESKCPSTTTVVETEKKAMKLKRTEMCVIEIHRKTTCHFLPAQYMWELVKLFSI